MNVCDWRQVREFKETHKNCDLTTKLTDDDKNTVVIRCAYHSQLIVASIPYRDFCFDIKNCAGHHSCPRSYACSE